MGDQILFAGRRSATITRRFGVVNADGSSLHELGSTRRAVVSGRTRRRWGATHRPGRRTGRRSSYVRSTPEGEDEGIYIANADGSGSVRVTEGEDDQPDWGTYPLADARGSARFGDGSLSSVAVGAAAGVARTTAQPGDSFRASEKEEEDARDGSSRPARSRLVLGRPRVAVERPPETFEDFYMREYPAVVGLAYALSGSRWGAEDFAQEAFLAAHRDWERIGAYEQPGAWVRRVVANLPSRRSGGGRRRRRRWRGSRQSTPRSRTSRPSHPAFWAAVRSLPRRQAQVVALFYLEDRPIADGGTILDMTPGTVKRHLYDARKELARGLRAKRRCSSHDA